MSTPLELNILGTRQALTVTPSVIISSGYTGRDPAQVRAHIDELMRIGVPLPAKVPAFFVLSPDLMTTASTIKVHGKNTSGEVEPVLLRVGDQYYLGLGSDHTDRDIEREDVTRAKLACPKPIARTVMPLGSEPVCPEWDDIVAHTTVDTVPYQHGTLKDLRDFGDLLSQMADSIGALEGDFVVYGGTVSLTTGHFISGTSWKIELRFPSGYRMRHRYTVERVEDT